MTTLATDPVRTKPREWPDIPQWSLLGAPDGLYRLTRDGELIAEQRREYNPELDEFITGRYVLAGRVQTLPPGHLAPLRADAPMRYIGATARYVKYPDGTGRLTVEQWVLDA